MSKLVLFLPDGTTLDVPLARERTTIGRRADNDICLPNLAVSGEHAVVVTILADSFLEDLGSTNGTLVNGKAVAKHFLRDRDKIDVGRHRLVYCVDEEAKLESEVAGMDRIAERDFGGRVEPAKPFARKRGGADASPRVARVVETTPSQADLPEAAAEAAPAPPASPVPATPAPPRGPSLKVLTGVNAGASIALTKQETTLGRPGVQVALIVKAHGSFRLRPVEGISPPALNGQPVGSEGADLVPGDILEVAGTRLEFVDPTRQATTRNLAA
jgi:hypothetical protein